jgi:hypothetical protein
VVGVHENCPIEPTIFNMGGCFWDYRGIGIFINSFLMGCFYVIKIFTIFKWYRIRMCACNMYFVVGTPFRPIFYFVGEPKMNDLELFLALCKEKNIIILKEGNV